MIRFRLNRHGLVAIFATLSALLFVQTADAKTVPYVAFGLDAEYNPATGDYSGPGIGIPVGVHKFAGNVVPDGEFFPEPGIFFAGDFAGTQVVTTSNGDTIESSVSGTVLLEINPESGLVTGTWHVDFKVTGGTGRYANARGRMKGIAINPPFDPTTSAVWNFDWFMKGKIKLARRKRR